MVAAMGVGKGLRRNGSLSGIATRYAKVIHLLEVFARCARSGEIFIAFELNEPRNACLEGNVAGVGVTELF